MAVYLLKAVINKSFTNKIKIMKKVSTLELTKTEKVAAILLAIWLIAGCFIPLPPINSLGY